MRFLKLTPNWLLNLTKVAIITVLLVVSSSLAVAMIPAGRSALREYLTGSEVRGYRVGEQIEMAPELFAPADSTLLMFVRSTCGICRKNASFLGAVSAAARSAGLAVVPIVLGPASPEDEIFVREAGLDRNRLIRQPTAPRIGQVPTFLGVSRQGRIFFMQIGIPRPAEDQGQFLRRFEVARRSLND